MPANTGTRARAARHFVRAQQPFWHCEWVSDPADGFDAVEFVDRPHTAWIAFVTPQGRPGLATVWCLLDSEGLWFHSRAPALVAAAEAGAPMAAGFDVFDPPRLIARFKVSGPSRAVVDGARCQALYSRYLGEDPTKWNPAWVVRCDDPDFTLMMIRPEAGGIGRFHPDLHSEGTADPPWIDWADLRRRLSATQSGG